MKVGGMKSVEGEGERDILTPLEGQRMITL